MTKLSSMNTLTGPASSSYSLVFLIWPSINAALVFRGTHTYLRPAEKSSTAIETLCANPSLGSDNLPSIRYASDSGLSSSTEPSGSSSIDSGVMNPRSSSSATS